MLLQSLVDFYHDLEEQGKVLPRGWELINISYVLDLNADGNIVAVESVKQERTIGKKTIMVPTAMLLPATVARTSAPRPNFLWDNSAYILGFDEMGNSGRAKKAFSACQSWHKEMLSGIDSLSAKALSSFFENWNYEKFREHPALVPLLGEITFGNITFRVNGSYVVDDPKIRAAWDTSQEETANANAVERTSLATGTQGKIAKLHPQFKGIVGAQPSGAALVSFNAASTHSYALNAGMNAQTSEFDTYAYGTALNYLLKDRSHVNRVGETTILCWAQGGEAAYQDLFTRLLFQGVEKEPEALLTLLCDLSNGIAVEYDGVELDPKTTFYVLGLSPNASRLYVRLFHCGSFGEFLGNILTYYQDVEIKGNFSNLLHVWRALRETVNPMAKNKNASTNMSADMLDAVLTGDPYPPALWHQVQDRILIEHDVTWRKAAITKAYFMRDPHVDVQMKEEVLTVALNKESKNIPYAMGRLFAVIISIQDASNPNAVGVIQANNFSSAITTPASTFPFLLEKAYGQIKRLNDRLAASFDRQIMELLDLFDQKFPETLTDQERGAFILGFYHQMSAKYNKTEKE